MIIHGFILTKIAVFPKIFVNFACDMKLLCESGATKGDWRVIGGQDAHSVLTGGTNVSAMSREAVLAVIREAAGKLPEGPYESVHFYTAGVITDDIRQWLETALKEAFLTEKAEVQTDLLAAARAACGHSAGIAVILGTGSNSCLYDGQKIIRQVKSGGYIIGDEGSASVLGKLFISDYIKGLVPEEIARPFDEAFPGLDYPTVVTKVYHSPAPSAWLGSFCPFILSHYNHPYIKALVDGNLQAFIDRCLKQYDTDRYPVGIIGGFGNALKDILTPLLERSGVSIRAFIPSPIEELLRYHA